MITLARGGGISLIAYADIGDLVALEHDGAAAVSMTGPMADEDDEAAVAAALGSITSGACASISVGKLVPFDEGLGSAAPLVAAAIRILKRTSGRTLEPDFSALGSDVFACLNSSAVILSNEGVSAASLPILHAVLAHAGGEPGSPAEDALPDPPSDWGTVQEVAQWLGALPFYADDALAEIVDELALSPGCLLARPSGAGGTCYGLFPDRSTADGAAAHLANLYPAWWVAAATLS